MSEDCGVAVVGVSVIYDRSNRARVHSVCSRHLFHTMNTPRWLPDHRIGSWYRKTQSLMSS